MNRNTFFSYIIVTIIIGTFFSCNNERESHNIEKTIPHSIDLLGDEIKISRSFDDVFSWIKTIPLTFQDETVLGEISKVIRTNDRFYVLDGKMHSLYEFDQIGLNTNRYGNVGQGPGEYIRIDDFLIDSLNQQLVILGNEGRAGIYFYDLKTSAFIRKISVDIYPLSFCKYGEDFLVYTSKNPSEKGEFDVFKIDNNGEITNQFMPYKIDLPIISTNSGFLKKSAKDIFYVPQYNEQIYMFDGMSQSFQPYMKVSINNEFVEKNKNSPMEIFKSGAVMDENTSFLMSSYESNDVYTMLSFHRKKGLGTAVYKNRTKEIIQIVPESLKSDIRYRIISIFSPHTLSVDDEVLFSIDPSNILKERERYLENKDIPQNLSRLIEDSHIEGQDKHYLVVAKIRF